MKQISLLVKIHPPNTMYDIAKKTLSNLGLHLNEYTESSQALTG